jgi:hypothetical protein
MRRRIHHLIVVVFSRKLHIWHESSAVLSWFGSSYDFCLFSELKILLKTKNFLDIEDIKSSVTRMLRDVPIQDFKNCFEQWEHG